MENETKTTAKKTPRRKIDYGFKRRQPDVFLDSVIEALAPEKKPVSFNVLFEKTWELHKAKSSKYLGGGEEALRLRCYEKVQGLISKGGAVRVERAFQPTKRIMEFHSSTAEAK